MQIDRFVAGTVGTSCEPITPVRSTTTAVRDRLPSRQFREYASVARYVSLLLRETLFFFLRIKNLWAYGVSKSNVYDYATLFQSA
jgi:hypothetical protein